MDLGGFWAALQTASSAAHLWSLFTGSAHTCSCEFVFAPPAIEADKGVLQILQAQLERCGPEQLARPCAPCPVASCSGVAAGSFLAGVFVGVLLVVWLAAPALCKRRQRPALEDAPAVPAGGEEDFAAVAAAQVAQVRARNGAQPGQAGDGAVQRGGAAVVA